MMAFGFFALVLVSVYWVNRAVVLFDRLIADGQPALVFLEFTVLSLPAVIAQILPIAAFAAPVYVTNRLSSESELTVMQATGFSPWRLARPFAVFAVLMALVLSIFSHLLTPMSLEQLSERENEISGNVTARILKEGTFLHPSAGVTFYIREISSEGELRDVFLSDRRNDGLNTIYTAAQAYLLNAEEGPRLVMIDGLAQTLATDGQRLSTTTFKDFSHDISALIQADAADPRRIKHVSTAELLTRPARVAAEAHATLGQVVEEAHRRFTQPLLSFTAALIGFATLLVGSFSRFGVWRQILWAIFLLVVLRLAESAVSDPLRSNPDLWPLLYAPILLGLVMTGGLLASAGRPRGRRRRAAPEVAA